MALGKSSYVVNEGETPVLPIQMLNDADEPVAKSLVSSISLKLYYVDSDGDVNVINSRTATDVLGTNGGTYQDDLTITAATQTNPVVVTITSHGLLDDYNVLITSVSGMTELNDNVWKVRRLTSDTFSLRGSKGASYTAYTSGGTMRTGLFLWQSAAADMAIQNSSLAVGDSEEHVAQFTFTFTNGNVAVHEYKFRVRNLG